MSTRRKLIKKDIKTVKVCDTCGQDHPNVKVTYKCKSCKEDICHDCVTIIDGRPVCKKCKEPCPGCGEYPIHMLSGYASCPICGYNLKGR